MGSLSFDRSRLRKLTAADLAEIIRDDAIGDQWAEDHDRIVETFGSANVGDAVNPGDRRAVYHLVAGLKPKRVLEIGTNVGGALIAMAQAVASHVEPPASLTTVDIVEVNDPEAAARAGLSHYRTPAEHLDHLGLSHLVTFLTGSALELMASTEERFDLIFLDGDHAAPAVYRDVSAALKLLRPDGVVLLHDVYPGGRPLFPSGAVINGPIRALERIRSEAEQVVVLPLGSLPWPTKLGSRMTSLAVLTTA